MYSSYQVNIKLLVTSHHLVDKQDKERRHNSSSSSSRARETLMRCQQTIRTWPLSWLKPELQVTLSLTSSPSLLKPPMLCTDGMSRQEAYAIYSLLPYIKLLKLQFRFQFYCNFGFKIIYRYAINATIRQPIPVINNSVTKDKLS